MNPNMVRVFSEYSASELEKKVNEWLEYYKKEIEVKETHFCSGNVAAGQRLNVLILYKHL